MLLCMSSSSWVVAVEQNTRRSFLSQHHRCWSNLCLTASITLYKVSQRRHQKLFIQKDKEKRFNQERPVEWRRIIVYCEQVMWDDQVSESLVPGLYGEICNSGAEIDPPHRGVQTWWCRWGWRVDEADGSDEDGDRVIDLKAPKTWQQVNNERARLRKDRQMYEKQMPSVRESGLPDWTHAKASLDAGTATEHLVVKAKKMAASTHTHTESKRRERNTRPNTKIYPPRVSSKHECLTCEVIFSNILTRLSYNPLTTYP